MLITLVCHHRSWKSFRILKNLSFSQCFSEMVLNSSPENGREEKCLLGHHQRVTRAQGHQQVLTALTRELPSGTWSPGLHSSWSLVLAELCHRETWQELSFVSHLVPVWRALLCFPWEQVLVLGTLLYLECPAPDSSWMCKYPLCSKSGLMACGPSPAWAIFLWDLLPFLHRRCEKCCKNRLLMHLPSAFNSSCWDSDLRGSDPTLVTLWRVASRTQ